VLLRVGDAGMAVVLPKASQLLPDWCAAPDASGVSRLSTLGQELGMLVLPPPLEASDAKVQELENLGSALLRGGLAASAIKLAINLSCDERRGELSLIWPLTAPDKVLAGPDVAAPSANDPSDAPAIQSASSAPAAAAKPRDLAALPGYSRSLLKIRVPVSVQLAGKKESVQEVITLAPGSIIKFEKGCEELLQMIVGERTIAEGEAVKIGEKFGFRVTSMKLPPEHFAPARKPRRA
jgi:flagellar motor switch protein FliN